jgi:signal transduction histidine kinase
MTQAKRQHVDLGNTGNAGSILKSVALKEHADKQHKIENRIIRDLIICTVAVIAFSSLAYFLNLLEMLAVVFNRPEFREIDTLVLIIIYAVWTAGIFVLRRLYELRQVAAERRQLVEQLHSAQRTETVERMASGLSHDFNNVLTIISGQADICLLGDKIDSSSRESFVRIKQAVQNGSALIKQLMTLGSGKMKMEASNELDLAAAICGIVPLLRSLTGNKIEIKNVLDPQAGNIKAEKSQIDEMLINLTKNAMDAICCSNTADGVITLTTSNIRVDDADAYRKLGLKPGDYVRLSVADNGHGIDPDIIPHIFDPYFTTKPTGTGLGLAMVMNIVNQNSGKIEVQSAPGKGSSFNIFFPAAKKTTTVVEFSAQESPAANYMESSKQAECQS